ncbi:UDP-N-acetylglucosamine transporter [Reticulomyxa filosa]|uniref:UDP-N-acetylglucosamine transporter n=1 Tax=Reticulomyxa filosa TaxID=46433 RepID=X6MI24_RETFI|nr:UDP-N-acetylglucosamine transporter [Reticulomyxa filosa]|eukprot:ETO13082.1 UDP-N-acetylglucosamine transporter [Reticulomyxa filosa]
MLQYTALQNLPAPVYAVLQQLKILSAAVCSYLILRESLASRQWRALFLLMAGGILIENHTFEIHASGNLSLTANDPVKGTIAILTIVSLSGVAGVITQLLLKNKSTSGTSMAQLELSVWDRNAQLAFWSILIGVFSLILDYQWITDHKHIFFGWTLNTWILVFLWSSGGILVALTIKYTDVIIKGFASAISLIVISVLGWLVLGDVLDLVFGIGAIVTVIATFNYNDKDPVSTGSMIKKGSNNSANVSKNDADNEINDEDDVVYIDPKEAEKPTK